MSKTVQPITHIIKLSAPVSLADGSIIEEINVREPTVRDFRKSSQQSKNAEERELIVAAMCCGLTIEDLELIKWKDYQKIQKFLFADDADD